MSFKFAAATTNLNWRYLTNRSVARFAVRIGYFTEERGYSIKKKVYLAEKDV